MLGVCWGVRLGVQCVCGGVRGHLHLPAFGLVRLSTVVLVLCCCCCALVPAATVATHVSPPTTNQHPQLLWAEGGVRRFYRGFTPCLIRAAPANGAMLLTVDTVTNWLNKHT